MTSDQRMTGGDGMTARGASARQDGRGSAGPARVPWRRMARVTWRQHRTALAWMLLVIALAAAEMAVTGGSPPAARLSPSRWTLLLLQAIPLLAGLFLGAPLLARETEHGTARLAWTQGASRTRWLLAKAIPIAVSLAIAAVGLGLEFRWWTSPSRYPVGIWPPQAFDVQPLPFAGWVTLGFCLGVFLGAVIRRAVPAMAATLACYVALLATTTRFLRTSYLPPLRRAVPVQISAGGGYSYGAGAAWRSPHSPTPDVLRSGLGWPDGRLLSPVAMNHRAAWFALHHIRLWLTYQPASRYGLFECIESGWLIALCVILIAGTAVLIRRRPA